MHERRVTWAWLARHGTNAATGLLGGRGFGLGVGEQRTSLSLLIVPAEAIVVDLVHVLPDATIACSGYTISITCCKADARCQHMLMSTDMVGTVMVEPCTCVAACASIIGRLCTDQQQDDTIAVAR